MKTVIFIIVCSVIYQLTTQNCEGAVRDSARDIGLLVRTNIGFIMPMNKSQTYNRATDLMYNNLEDYVTFFRIFDATLFFYKYLGVELSWKFSPQNGDWKPGLDNEISTMYPDFYKDYPSLTFDDMKQQNIMFGLN